METGPEKRIYTIGTSNRSLPEFLHILMENGVKTVVDVRRFPTSRFGHFRRENLEPSLKKTGILYRDLGDLLGGFRNEGFPAYLETVKGREGLETLERIALKDPCAIFCAEKLPWRCHRRFIGHHFREKGWDLVHIIDEKRVWQPK